MLRFSERGWMRWTNRTPKPPLLGPLLRFWTSPAAIAAPSPVQLLSRTHIMRPFPDLTPARFAGPPLHVGEGDDVVSLLVATTISKEH